MMKADLMAKPEWIWPIGRHINGGGMVGAVKSSAIAAFVSSG